MKVEVGQYLLSLTSFGYNNRNDKFDFPVIMQVVQVKPYVIVAKYVRNGNLMEIRKAHLKNGYKLLSPVEKEFYD